MGSFDSSASSASEIGTLTGSQFLWGSPNCIEDTVPSTWMMSSLGQSAKSNGKRGNFVRSNEPSDRSLGSPHSFGNMDVYQNEGSTINTFLPRGPANPLKSYSGLISGNSSLRLRTMPPQRMGNMFLGSFPYARQGSSGIEGFSEPVRIHRTDHCGSQLESQQQFQLDLDKIISGDDTRTTLMIKNIPNKYTSEMLLVAIDENHGGAYDFFYLPIDFKNKCNVGYAFINLLSPFHIISFYQAFNGKKWEKFNSEKVASLAYARIQGKSSA
ncbi:hypothetical protein HPP92_007853 [Vanilla planifolia]|uniref:Mei2-like C-terminal RNA recognition motif domain-containing protein n=1 Tax=Vanilla planifolia TaxID=51239 RepID=A0A835VBM2_VANPL|nr:hypothetical protein HPP92_007853 [Vanilla planifolia]